MDPQLSLSDMMEGRFGQGRLKHPVGCSINKQPSKDDSVLETPTKASVKSRSLSDSVPRLGPSPSFKESSVSPHGRNISSIPCHLPRGSNQPGVSSILLAHQMDGVLASAQSPFKHAHGYPISPTRRMEPRSPYNGSMSVLPRHSRGLDFSRAATHLHKSTLADSSPDSSPSFAHKTMAVPSRKHSIGGMSMDIPMWQPGFDRAAGTSTVLAGGNTLVSDDSSSDDNIELIDIAQVEDGMLTTPNLHGKTSFGFNGSLSTSWGMGNGIGTGSPASNSFLHYRRKWYDRRSRKSSSSASGNSNLVSPAPASPAPTRTDAASIGRDAWIHTDPPRRESLSFGTNRLTLSSGNDSGDEAGLRRPDVIRRAVTRRGNLLPKTRAFGRIKAELQEEGTAIESEVRREAEVIRQVRESDIPSASHNTTSHSSPLLQPSTGLDEFTQSVSAGSLSLDVDSTSSTKTENSGCKGVFGVFGAFGASGVLGASGIYGSYDSDKFKDYPNHLSNQSHAPSPLVSNSTGEEMVLDSLLLCHNQTESYHPCTPSTHSNIGQPPTAADGLRKNNKRRRDDDLDTGLWKRRAVSPGLSGTNSPILSQSPAQRGEAWNTIQPSPAVMYRENSAYTGGHAAGERSNSVSSQGPKRVGLQGMTDMQGLTEKMSLE